MPKKRKTPTSWKPVDYKRSPRSNADIDDAPQHSSMGVWLVFAFIALCVIMSLSSCSRKVYLPVEHTVYRTDTLRTTALRVDSIFVRDSISVIQRGDTIFLEKYRDRFRYINHTDTLYRVKTDSIATQIPYPVEVIKEVPKPLAWWQQTLIWLGVAFLAILIFNLYIMIKKR